MKKLLLILFKSLGFIVCILIGFIAISLLYDFGAGLPLGIALLVIFTWFGRHDEDGLYRLFKDTHQSNLDDIERQELEEQDPYLFDTTKVLHYPKIIVQFFRKYTI